MSLFLFLCAPWRFLSQAGEGGPTIFSICPCSSVKGRPSLQRVLVKILGVALVGWFESHARHWANPCVPSCLPLDDGDRRAPPKSWGREGVPPGGSAESSCQEMGCGMCRMAAALPLLGPWEKLLKWFMMTTAVLYQTPVWCWVLCWVFHPRRSWRLGTVQPGNLDSNLTSCCVSLSEQFHLSGPQLPVREVA